MASRLSESALRKRRDAGHQNLPWLQDEGSYLLEVDFDRVLSSPDPKAIVRSIPPQVLYHGILAKGIEESREIICLASQDQFIRFLDYDAWPRDNLSLKSAMQWLKAMRVRGQQAMAERYRQLDEEYQIALLEGKVKIYSEEDVEALPDAQRDRLIGLPCNEAFYEVLTTDQEEEEFIIALVNAFLSYDVQYAYSLLAHAAFVPPNENEHTQSQFRRARLEEDGFVTYEESLQVFYPIDVEAMRAEWKLSSADKSSDWLIPIEDESEPFIERVVKFGIGQGRWTQEQGVAFQQGCLHLANAISTATDVEPGDIKGMNRLLLQIRAMLSLGLEYVSDGKEGIAIEILRSVYPRQLFQAGLTVFYQLQQQVINGLKHKGLPGIEKLQHYQQLQRWGLLQDYMDKQYSDKIPFEELAVLKGLFNRFPMQLVKKDEHRLVYQPVHSRNDYLKLVERLREEWKVMN